MKVLLLSTYDLGHQPFGLASPASWLRRDGHEVTCTDLAISVLPMNAVREAALIAIHLPMHTATRMAARVIPKIRATNPVAHIACYGLYAPLNDGYLRGLGVRTVLGGESEAALAGLANRLARGEPAAQSGPEILLDRLAFLPPDRGGLPSLGRYSKLRINGDAKKVGYTEASRGCKHLCRHCPVVPVYGGKFRVVSQDVVIEDIRRQVAAGAEHITFGDPDFLNGPAHAEHVVAALHAGFAGLTYDVTTKVEHLLRHCDLLPLLKKTGCLFITTAVESVEDEVLGKLDKGHTRADFIEAVALCRAAGLTLAPTFIPFTPWTTWRGYRDLLELIAELDLVENVCPVQLALRLLIPAGSRLLELPEIRERVGPFDAAALLYPWKHDDPAIDALSARVFKLVWSAHRDGASRSDMFRSIWEAAQDRPLPDNFDLVPRAAIPYMDEPWYC